LVKCNDAVRRTVVVICGCLIGVNNSSDRLIIVDKLLNRYIQCFLEINLRKIYWTISSRSFGLETEDNWISFFFSCTFISFFIAVGRRDGLLTKKIK
jgi:hypothetical protein